MNIVTTRASSKKNISYTSGDSESTGYYRTPAGVIKVHSTEKGIFKAYFTDEVVDVVFSKEMTPLFLIGTEFEVKVWQAVMAIPAGTTWSYQKLAKVIGHPYSSRAVAAALGRNEIAYLVPCHRVICKAGGLGGYRWGIEKKAALLAAEKEQYAPHLVLAP